MTIVGELALWIALLMSLWCAAMSLAATVTGRAELSRSGERGAHAAAAFGGLAVIGVWQALHRRDFSYAFVSAHITANMPDPYVFAALWSGAGGTTLLWGALVATAAAGATARTRREPFPPAAIAILGAVAAFAFALVAFTSNPFDRLPFAPADGMGMNPQLQNPAMLLHPPLLLAGMALTVPAFALGIAVTVRRSVTLDVLAAIRHWTLAAWVLLGVGILTGMWWAYVEPGWGGYWNWDPTQTAALLPWLACTGCLQATIIADRTGLFPKWTLVLATAPFIVAVLAACVARSGVLEGLHAFARSSDAAWFAALLIVVSVGATYLLSSRPLFRDGGLPSGPVARRDAAMVYGNVIVVGIALAVLIGLFVPLLSVWMSGTRLATGAAYFNRILTPLALLLVVLIVATPLLRSRSASHPIRRIGRIASSAGVVALVIAFTGMKFSRTHDVSLSAGQSYDATDPLGGHWRFTSQGISLAQRRNSEAQSVTLEVRHGGKTVGFLTSEQRQYVDTQGRPVFKPSSESAVRSGLLLDTYVVLAAVRDEVADIRITFNPLVMWVWLSGAIIILGGAVSFWPRGEIH